MSAKPKRNGSRPDDDFWQSKTLEELKAEQGVQPVERPGDLVADFWPEDETADDIIAAIRAMRREGRSKEAS